MEEEEGRELVRACWIGKWEDARAMIAKNPRLAWTANDLNGRTPAYVASFYNRLDFLQFMLDAILLQPLQTAATSQGVEKEQRRQMLQDAFEREDVSGWTPAHAAAQQDRVQCLAFLMDHAPSGAAVLERKADSGRTPAIISTCHGYVGVLDFIVRNAPSGVGVLEVKDIYTRTPLAMANYVCMQRMVEYINRITNATLPTLSGSKNQGYIGPCDYP